MGAEDFSGELVSGVSVAGDQIAGAGCQTKIAGKGMFTPVQIGPKDPEGTINVFLILNYINLAKNSDKDRRQLNTWTLYTVYEII